MKETILITGGSGYIGRAAAARLSRDYDIIGLDTRPPPERTASIDHVHVDLTSDDSVDTAIRSVNILARPIASVLHLAAYYDFSGEPSPLYEEVTVRGTERLLRALRPLQPRQLVFTSTMLVHAPCAPGERITEHSPLEPRWDYPRSKVETERLLLDQHGATPLVILRLAGVYDDRCHSIPLAHQIQRIHEKSVLSHVFPGDTSHGQAFVHLEDVVEALVSVVDRRRSLGDERIFLIGEDDTMSYEEVQRAVGALLHRQTWETNRVPKALARAGAWVQEQVAVGEEPFIRPWMIDLADDHYALDIARARRELGWRPRRLLRATLPIMVQALRDDPVGWYRENELTPPDWLESEARQA